MTQFHLARFGNKSGAHDVLGHSGVDPTILTAIVWRTDAPALSEGLGLEPFVSAYRLGESFIASSTTADLTAGRAGMVVTTAAVVPIAAAETLDLHGLWTTLSEPIAVDTPLETADFTFCAPESAAHLHPVGASAAASALIAKGRVIWVGPGFQNAVACMWTHLRPQDRTRLVVGAAAHPDRISVPTESASLQFIKTAASALPRWAAWPTASSESAEPNDPIRDAIFGDDAGTAERFGSRLGLGHIEFTTWRHLANAASLFDRLPTLDHEGTRGLLQLLGLIQPDPNLGSEVKAAGLEHLSNLTLTASFVDVRGLRGIRWGAYGSGANRQLFDIWAMASVPDDTRTSEIMAAAISLQSEASDWFLADLESAVSAAINPSHVERLVVGALKSADGASALTWLVKVRSAQEIDDAIASAAASGTSLPLWMQTHAQELRLPIAHAWSVPLADPVAAWKAQLALRSRKIAAENVLAERTGEAGIVAAAIALDDSKLLERAAHLIVADPSLLTGGDINDVRFRTLWYAAAAAGGDPWVSVRPAEAVVPLLDLLVTGDTVEPKVLQALAKTTSADIASYPNRASVWSKLPPAAATGFKEATAETIARSCKPGDPPIEHPLVDTVLSPALLASVSRESATQALTLLSSVPSATAGNAFTVIQNGTFTPADEAILGNLVRMRGWRHAAERIITLSAGRTDLARAAAAVDSMFGFFDRISRYISSGSPVVPIVTKTELHDALTDVTAQLYPQGPLTEAVWERAGGDDADLVTGKTGRLTWGRALQDILAGRKGAPSLEGLLAIMLEDYPTNPQLLALKNTTESGTHL